jgi:hypothetical protein
VPDRIAGIKKEEKSRDFLQIAGHILPYHGGTWHFIEVTGENFVCYSEKLAG